MPAAQRLGPGYVLGVSPQFGCERYSAKEALETLPAEVSQRLSAGRGPKGERLCEWARLDQWPLAEPAGWTRQVVARRRLHQPRDMRYFAEPWPGGAGRPRSASAPTKQKAGLADKKVRTWSAWHHRVSFAMAAAACHKKTGERWTL